MALLPSFRLGSDWLETRLAAAATARVAVFGDLCLDAYWILDEARQENSLETGLPVHAIGAQHYGLGGAGNVAANLQALGARDVRVIGVVGPDLFGQELLRQFAGRGFSTESIEVSEQWRTLVYAKPYRGAHELNRIDFGGDNSLPGALVAKLLTRIEDAAKTCRVVVVNQQVTTGWAESLIPELNRIIARNPQTLFVVDSRHYAADFQGVALKLNRAEASRILKRDTAGAEDAAELAHALAARQGKPVLVTRGEDGLILAADGQLYDIPGIELPGRIDAVGAGDAALAGFAVALATDAEPMAAGCLANLAAAITTRQLRTTGLAHADGLRSIGPVPDYIYRPRLARQPRLAHGWPDSEIELASGNRPAGRFRYAIFDHDGTISTLRQGWEAIMEPMMVKAIAGDRLGTFDDEQHATVLGAVKAHIDRTTGIQTLAQMKGLAALVREFGHVPESTVLDEHGYKAIFNEELLAMVAARRARLERGELGPGDFEVKNARELLQRLAGAGVTLFLASGTDEADVKSEAQAMGYADLFNGGIFGAVGDLKIEAKRVVMGRILETAGMDPSELVVFGDGPVEIREGVKRGAFTVGVASDEIRRYGMDFKKRTRLIRAGADIVIPDYAQLETLLDFLGWGKTKSK